MFEKYKEMTFPSRISFPFPQIDEEKCVGCGRCVQTCPIQLFMLNENQKCCSNDRYDDFWCILCENCIAVCPENAITIKGAYRVHTGFWKNDHLFESDQVPPYAFTHTAPRGLVDSKDQLTEVETVILKRRSIRLYRKKQVEPEKVYRILEAGRYAPSAGNNQPWKFIVIQNRELIDKIDHLCRIGLRKVTKLALPYAWLDKKVPGEKLPKLKWWQKIVVPLLVKWRPGDIDVRVRGGVNAVASDPNYHTFFNAPTLILQCMDKRAIGGTEFDAGICAQNMVLAAHAMGLGTCYVGLIDAISTFNVKFIREDLGLEEPFIIAMALTLGYPKGKIDGVVNREPLRVKWINPK
jgi:nitroreductase/NAD-dependent dihydropyrimidine dehydrogenase PreA subunit